MPSYCCSSSGFLQSHGILYDNVGELALSLFITVTDLCLASHVGGVGELGYVPVALSFFWTDDGQSQLLSRV